MGQRKMGWSSVQAGASQLLHATRASISLSSSRAPSHTVSRDTISK